MVSGDHQETAKAIALKAWIVSDEDLRRTYSIMSGENFRESVG